MSDEAAMWKAYHEQRKAESHNRRCEAARDFEEAKKLAAEFNLQLKQFSETHYQLTNTQWFLNLYPGNQRIIRVGRAPHVTVLIPWTLFDAVKSIGEKLAKEAENVQWQGLCRESQ